MLQLLMILLGLNFNNTNTAAPHSGKTDQNYSVSQNQTSNAEVDTGGETQPIPPRK